jgi:hypothetical protein
VRAIRGGSCCAIFIAEGTTVFRRRACKLRG